MIFGEGLEPAPSSEVADWIGPACGGADWTVGALVPTTYPSFLRIHAPEPADEWWSAYRDLFAVVAAVGERHTRTPEDAWFAVWDGHGFVGGRTRISGANPTDESERAALGARQAQLDAMDAERDAAVAAGLREVPLIHRPHRSYHLMSGPVAAVSRLRRPDAREEWFRPDLFWPDDRRWFAATDVDFWSIYVGGENDLIAELREHVPTPAELVAPGRPLEPED